MLILILDVIKKNYTDLLSNLWEYNFHNVILKIWKQIKRCLNEQINHTGSSNYFGRTYK